MRFIVHQYFIWTAWNLFFRIYPFVAWRMSNKITINFVTFVTGWELTSWYLLRPWSRQFWTYEPKRHRKGSPFEAEWRSLIRRRRKRRRSFKMMTRKKPHQCLRWQGRGCVLVRKDTGWDEVQCAVQCLLYFTLCVEWSKVGITLCITVCTVQHSV